MCMTVADASVFIWGKRPEGELITVPAVEAELKDIRARSLLHIYETRVESPTTIALKAARDAAEQTETSVLSLRLIWRSWPRHWSIMLLSLPTTMLCKTSLFTSA